MSKDLMLDVGQANELKLAFRRADFSNDDIKRLCEGDVLTDVRSVLRGYACITAVTHVIDCDADPFVPDGFTLEAHKKDGQFSFGPAQVVFHQVDGQRDNRSIKGTRLRTMLEDLPVLNVNVLDFLLTNPHLIPEEWKSKVSTRYIYFWGTIYRDSRTNLYVRCLCWSEMRWRSHTSNLNDYWKYYDTAAVRKTNLEP